MDKKTYIIKSMNPFRIKLPYENVYKNSAGHGGNYYFSIFVSEEEKKWVKILPDRYNQIIHWQIVNNKEKE